MCLNVSVLIYAVLSDSCKQAIERVGRGGARKLSGDFMPVKPLKSKRGHEKNEKQGHAIILAHAIFDRDKIRKNKRGR
jgi:hypothetical protein